MSWYDVFSRSYDSMLEKLYVDARARATAALDLRPGLRVLDLPCGTGQSFEGIAPLLTPGGRLVGVDLSAGMLRRARERVQARGWTHVEVVQSDVHAVGDALQGASFDRLHVFLGLSTFPRWEEAFHGAWTLLRPGGRCVVVDVHAARLGLQGRMVNLVARADIRRRFWEPLEKVSEAFELRDLPSERARGDAEAGDGGEGRRWRRFALTLFDLSPD